MWVRSRYRGFFQKSVDGKLAESQLGRGDFDGLVRHHLWAPSRRARRSKKSPPNRCEKCQRRPAIHRSGKTTELTRTPSAHFIFQFLNKALAVATPLLYKLHSFFEEP
jgi:hypothetical protein